MELSLFYPTSFPTAIVLETSWKSGDFSQATSANWAYLGQREKSGKINFVYEARLDRSVPHLESS